MITTPGQRHDSLAFELLMDDLCVKRPGRGRPRRRPDALLADKAYANRAIRSHLRDRRITAVIPLKTDQLPGRRRRGARGRLPGFDPEAYRQRNVVERAVNKLRNTRAVATRYDKRDFRLPRHHRRRSNQDLATRPRPTRYPGHGLG
jgi:transposase